jgi:hypothetical protein
MTRLIRPARWFDPKSKKSMPRQWSDYCAKVAQAVDAIPDVASTDSDTFAPSEGGEWPSIKGF